MTLDAPDEGQMNSEELLKALSFCVVDLETTGGNHQYDKIIEIGLIKIEQLKIVNEMSFLINPEIPIPDFIQKLTSIHPNDLAKCPQIEQVIDKIIDFMGDSILVAHNSSFDIPFLNSVLARLQRGQLKNKTLCTNLMTKNLIPDIVNSNLPYMSKIFGIHHTRAHRALEDAKATAYLLIQYLNFFIEKNIRKVNQLYYPRKKFELDCLHFKTKGEIAIITEKISRIKTPLLITVKGEKGIILDILPILSPKEELPFIESRLHRPWKTITLKMVGSFLQGFYYLNQNFTKMPKSNQIEILQYLHQRHLPKNDGPIIKIDLKTKTFIIARHLIPEQYILYTFPIQLQKKELIYRHPGHLQKLYQHLEKSIKKSEFKNSEEEFHRDPLMQFLHKYLKTESEKEVCNYYIFTDKIFRNKLQEFKAGLENFSSQSKDVFNYPQEHI